MRIQASLRIGGHWVKAPALIDSGAEVNMIHPRLLGDGGLVQLDDHVAVSSLFNGKTETLGSCDLLTRVKDAFSVEKTHRPRFVVADIGPLDVILGFPWLEDADPIISWKQRTFVFPADPFTVKLCVSKKEVRKAIQDARWAMVAMAYPVVDDREDSSEDTVKGGGVSLPQKHQSFSPVFSLQEAKGLAVVDRHAHAIELEDGVAPPYGPIYPLAEPELVVLREYLDDMLARGWIQPSRSPAGAPILFVPKKGGKLRLCVDYRALNRITKKNRAPLPLIGEILDRLSKAKVYTKLDLKDAYHRIRIEPGDEWKTAFRCRYGHFEYRVMPFGLVNAPATFQTFINEVLGDLVDTICIVYLDDILIYSEKEEEHTQHVHRVLERLQQHNLYVNLAKCAFDVQEVEFLGYVIDPQGIRMEPSRIEAIRTWPEPRSVKDIQVFTGFAGFYRRFIRSYSKVTAPLTDLLKGGVVGRLQLGPLALEAFMKLRLLFGRAPFLRHYDPTLPIRVETDASAFAIGAVLSQLWEGRWHPVAFLSRKLHGAELRYDTPDAELMAIVEAFRTWRPYLAYAQDSVQVLTDHLNHRYLATKPKLSWRQARWMEEMSVFDFKIEYREGKKNPADGLSRRPDLRVSGEALEARKAPLASFLGRFTSAPWKEAQVAVAVRLLRTLSYPETVGLARACRPPAASHFDYLLRRTSESAARGHSPAGLLQHGRLGPHHGVVQDDQGSWGLPASVVGVTDRELSTPWPVVRWAGDGPITAPLQLLPPLAETIRDAQQRDAFVTQEKWKQWRSSRDIAGSHWRREDDSLLRYKGRVYVPEVSGLREEILKLFHDAPTAGHQGITKTQKRLSTSFFWQSMSKDVRRYVSTCAVCQRTKARTHLPYGELAALPIPTKPWKEISLDFITKLPPSVDVTGKVCDSILVIVDRFTKYALYIPTTERLTSDGLATLLLHHVFRQFGIPDGIVSDRGSVFTSKFWSAFCWHLGTSRRLSTAFHPQTDGQTERQNQSAEHYLRTYCGHEQDDWAPNLCLAEYVYNTSWHSATSTSPARALFGFDPRGPYDIPRQGPQPVKAPAADQRASHLRSSRDAITLILQHSRSVYEKWYNKGRIKKSFAVSDWVLLSTKHLRSRRPSRKLADKFIGPYQIEGVAGDHGLAYKLRLPSSTRLHSTFPITSLEPYRPRTGEDPASPTDIPFLDETSYEVEAILDHKGPRRNRFYLIKWKDYDDTENSWEPRGNLDDGPLLRDYENSFQAKGN
jgi:transposase InsO family protein